MNYENFEKFDMLECYILQNKSSELAAELYFNRYPERRQPNAKIFSRLEKNLKTFGSFKKPRPKSYYKENEDEEINVLAAVTANSSISSREMENDLGISRNRCLRVLHKHKYKPYVPRIMHHLRDGDTQRRLEFCRWYVDQVNENPVFSRAIIWTDEAHISSAEIFNRNNQHIWSNVNPQNTIERRTQGRFGFNVWVALLNNEVLAYQIYQENLNAERYLNILTNHIERYVDGLPLRDAEKLYFQHDGAPAHTARRITDFLNINFEDNWIGSSGNHRWPPRSPDLTPLDFFLWGYIKNQLYLMDNGNIRELKINFEHCLNSIPNISIFNAINSVRKRCEICIEKRGGQFEHFL
ncbi:uncharacterized protein [Onthophagus taurus]|uniref:uncharacterized protein isoform X2 n=1 Tax=Onthophagus taurus TaxID=166361 RepID=UPI0039BE577D